MHILLLSAYDTDSHKSWCQGLMSHLPEHNWCYLTLPGRYFSWRIRGNGLSFVYGEQAKQLNQDFDLIIATSMVDLATIKGLHQNLANTPSLIYFHENQFAYPKSEHQHTSIEPQMVNLYSALSADRVIFNSQYNRQSFLQGMTGLLKQLPDHAPLSAVEAIKQKSHVLPVPIHAANQTPATSFKAGDTLKVIWNHRWEYDKGPDGLLACIKLAHDQKLNVSFTICGMSFRNHPPEFKALHALSLPNVIHMGTFETKQEYMAQLAQHHVVLSTAHHEFQGLAVLEGAAHGCIPLAPNRLAYPEWISPQYLFSSTTPSTEAHDICERLNTWQLKGLPQTVDVCHYDWTQLIPTYLEHFHQTCNKWRQT